MRTNSISQNHVELTIGQSTICFSYGKPIAAQIGSVYYLNNDFYNYSVTTSKHLFASFPILREALHKKLSDKICMKFVSDTEFDSLFAVDFNTIIPLFKAEGDE